MIEHRIEVEASHGAGKGARLGRPARLAPARPLAEHGLVVRDLWIRAKAVDQEERGNAERRALFVGLWPPMCG
jgi:hypothetical protein